MENLPRSGQVVFTNKARCRDCNRCVRVCPVKAIRMSQEQAFVVEDRCIGCGTCIRECPQGAKSFRNDVEKAVRLVKSGAPVVASVAPSFAAIFTPWQQKRLASALRKLGFAYIAETAVGAYHVAQKTAQIVRRDPDHPHICTACPAVVRYVERYEPGLIDWLTPVVSPMIAHARMLKAGHGPEARVIFIGPCVAKKTEADAPAYHGIVDCVLTFTELLEWMNQENILLNSLEESSFDQTPQGHSRIFPLVGGSIRTADMCTDLLDQEVISVSGFTEVRESLAGLTKTQPNVIEPLFCTQGCINGPAVPSGDNLYHRRKNVIAYAAAPKEQVNGIPDDDPELIARFKAQPILDNQMTAEEDIRAVLEKTGRAKSEDQLNCGACGYSSCREKAIAVIRGMAEIEMCIPYMKRLAEQRTDRIIETSPNGIVILDERLNIIHMNPAFRRYFMCSEAVYGKRISYLMDPDPFEKLASGTESFIETVVRHDRYNLIAHQILYPLKDENQYVGIFVNITKSQASQEKLNTLRVQTIEQARELMEHQISMAQKIGQFLGESTARGEALVENLMRLADDETDSSGPNRSTNRRRGNQFPWDMSTQK